MIDIGRQLRTRIATWREELAHHLSTPIATAAFEGVLTHERLSKESAAALARTPFAVGTKWGDCWAYGWFFTQITLPPCAAGQRVVFFSGIGGEQLVYVNGVAVGSIDRKHPYVLLTREAAGGDVFDIQIESYAGHGARLENLGPCPPERPAIPPTPEAQCSIRQSTVECWNEEAYQLYIDVETLCGLLPLLPDKSLRAQKVAQSLIDFTNIADFELPPSERTASFTRARAALSAALACKNGSTAPLMWLIGQSHIDLAWLWPLEETYHKSARTYANQLTLMEEYPEYNFLLCEPALLDMLKSQDAALWQRTLAAYERGQILPEGAFYVECDTNIPSGESLIRQLLWGKRWYRENFGIDSKVAWQPDTFGYSAALPQILKGFDVPYFATQKLLRADPECERFPYQNFVWEGLDGSDVQALSFFKNNAQVDPENFIRRWENDRSQQMDIEEILFPFGYGDGGGGATRDMVEFARRLEDLEGVPRSQYGSLDGFFERMAPTRNRWVGELYLAWHRGTYTAQRKTKLLSRRLEFALRDAEYLLALSGTGVRAQYADTLYDAWHALLMSQFHDVMGGVGIKRVHEEAEASLQDALNALKPMTEALQAANYNIVPDEGSYTLINTLPWERQQWVTLPDGSLRYVCVPPSGVVAAAQDLPQPDDASVCAQGEGFSLENRHLSLAVDAQGRIYKLIDKSNGLSLLNAGQVMNDWRLYQDVNTDYDAWELSRTYKDRIVDAPVQVEISVSSNTPALAQLKVTRIFGSSRATQLISLYASSRRVDFTTEVHWHERRKLLKVHFESDILSVDALHEIQFGYIRRPAHSSHAFAADRYEVCNHRYSALSEANRGYAVLNDGCYGVSTDRGEIALSLLRAPLVPDDTCDRGVQHMTYALYPFATSFEQSGTVQRGYELCNAIAIKQGTCDAKTGLWVDSPSIILDTVKPAEDGHGMVVRLYESLGMSSRGVLHLPFDAKCSECSMDECKSGEGYGTGAAFTVALRPFEVKTLRILRGE